MTADLVIQNCKIATHDGEIGSDLGVAVENGKITATGATNQLPAANEVIDADGDYLVPGIIDCHVHNRSPGAEYKEDWETATSAAAAGGVTSIITMGINDPPVNCPENYHLKHNLARENAIVDFQTIAFPDPGDVESIQPLHEAGCVGFKVLLATSNDALAVNDGQLYEMMKEIAKTGKPLAIHAENDEMNKYYKDKFQQAGKSEPIHHARSRPVISEIEAVSRSILFAEQTGCPIHIVHLGSGSGVEKIIEAKKRGVNVTAETLPQYLRFSEDVLRKKGNAARMNPPIREQEEREKLWKHGIDDEGIDCIGTDHAPHTPEEKGMDDPLETWGTLSGFVGLETEVPSMLTFVNEGKIPMDKWIYMHSTRPAQIYGLYPQKGSLQVGTDADFTLFNPEETWTLDARDLHSKTKVSPFDGESFTGKVTRTIVRGDLVYDHGTVTGKSGYGKQIDITDTE
jgi:dihydroorotase/allantoinase